jgi:hypothetical protein
MVSVLMVSVLPARTLSTPGGYSSDRGLVRSTPVSRWAQASLNLVGWLVVPVRTGTLPSGGVTDACDGGPRGRARAREPVLRPHARLRTPSGPGLRWPPERRTLHQPAVAWRWPADPRQPGRQAGPARRPRPLPRRGDAAAPTRRAGQRPPADHAGVRGQLRGEGPGAGPAPLRGAAGAAGQLVGPAERRRPPNPRPGPGDHALPAPLTSRC